MIVVLVGFMGAGKTTVGHILAERLGIPFVDSDLVIEQQLGRPIRDVFATEGESYFRDLEYQTVASLVRGQDAVVALGGGALGDARTRTVLRNPRVVYLRVGYSEAMTRVATDEFRPLLHRPDLEDIYRARLSVYEDLAAITIDTDGRRPDAVAMDVLAATTQLPSLPGDGASVFVTPVGGVYYSHIGPDLLDHVSGLLPAVPEAERAVIIEGVDDEAVAARVADQLQSLGLMTARVRVVDDQPSKTLAAYEVVVEALVDNAIHKGDLVVAVGGEAVCELAGFVAATFNRGMKLALVPTTLVAQADSSVGGKNGINLSRGHNLLGAIHQPIAVISDVNLACANRGRGYRSGLAEIAKHALISPSDLMDFVLANASRIRAGDNDVIRDVLTRSIEIKADIVSRDEREQGDRVYLNYGHTFAHAMDLVRGLSLGEDSDSLPLGLMAAAYLARRHGRVGDSVVERQRELLTALGLPTAGTFTFSEMQEAWSRDKKYNRGVRFVVLNGLGIPEGGVSADDATLTGVLDDLARG
ncbi:MAG TPA: bifunctional shikimate kinase/3-dehydroquinate synthase [Dermatophilaceae bacterium]